MPRSTPVAWYNLTHDRPRTAVALAGVGCTLVVIFLQLGFFESVLRTATIVLDRLDYDLAIVSRHYLYLADAREFPRVRLRQAESAAGVARAVPLYVRSGTWRSLAPADPAGGPWRRRPILVLGFVPGDRPFRRQGDFDPAVIERQLDRLEQPSALLIDRHSRREFGPQGPGTPVQLNREQFEIVGRFAMGTGFAADGAALLDDRNFARAFGAEALNLPTLGLVRIADGSGADEVARRLGAKLPGDVRVLTRATLEGQERLYWVHGKAIGILFVMGVVISFLVGVVVVYQVLSSDIADHLPEYATLKAIGYPGGRVSAVVIQQGLILGLVGYAAALLLAVLLYKLVEWYASLPMTLTWWILALVLVLAVAMTTGSALLSIRKVHAADPADLFR